MATVSGASGRGWGLQMCPQRNTPSWKFGEQKETRHCICTEKAAQTLVSLQGETESWSWAVDTRSWAFQLQFPALSTVGLQVREGGQMLSAQGCARTGQGRNGRGICGWGARDKHLACLPEKVTLAQCAQLTLQVKNNQGKGLAGRGRSVCGESPVFLLSAHQFFVGEECTQGLKKGPGARGARVTDLSWANLEALLSSCHLQSQGIKGGGAGREER